MKTHRPNEPGSENISDTEAQRPAPSIEHPELRLIEGGIELTAREMLKLFTGSDSASIQKALARLERRGDLHLATRSPELVDPSGEALPRPKQDP